jgi:hypothetical protein
MQWYDEIPESELLVPAAHVFANIASGLCQDSFEIPENLVDNEQFIKTAIASCTRRNGLDDSCYLQVVVQCADTGSWISTKKNTASSRLGSS